MVKFNEVMEEEKARRLNPVVLAFIGDAAYSLYIREKLVFASDYKTGTLQKLSSASVSAKGQAALLKNIEAKFTDTAREIFLLSTGFEAVVGYLYLTGAYARLDDLLSEEQDEVRG